MKKLLYIFVILLWGCTKPDIPIPNPPVQKIFDVSESNVIDKQDLHFDLSTPGTYTLTLINKESGQVLSRERFTGKVGENIKKIYTNSLPKGYLYLVLEDGDKKEIKKTTIIIN